MHLGRKTLSLLLSLALMLSLLPLAAVPAWADDPTTEWSDNKATSFSVSNETAKTVTITSAAELALLAYIVNNGTNYSGWTITLGTDLDLSAHKWTPIGNNSYPFTGVFDGQGHTISGLYVSGNYYYAGLFGFVSGGTVQDLTVRGSVTVTDIDSISAGGVAGMITNYNGKSTVQNCRSEVTVKATVESNSSNKLAYAGGIVGRITGNNDLGNSTVLNCYHSGNLSLTMTCTSYPVAYVGGVVANLYQNGTVQNCYHTGAVTATVKGASGTNYAGGVAGDISSSGTVQNCYSIGAISGSGASNEHKYTGGVAGKNYYGTVTGCYYLTGTADNGIGSDTGTGDATGLTSLNSQSSFTGWDFADTWVMGADAPLLQALAHTEHDGACAHDGWIAWSTTNALPDAPGAYYLTGNVTLSGTWDVPPGTTLLCLNGYTITAGSGPAIRLCEIGKSTLRLYDKKDNSGSISSPNGIGVIFSRDDSGSVLEMYGGTLTGCKYNGVYLTTGNTFTLYGGKICGITYEYAAGVCVAGGTFTMRGGEISGNSALYEDPTSDYQGSGGGVYVTGGTFTMRGGTITGNSASNHGGGVYMKGGTFTVSGDARIYGNVKGGDKDEQTGMYTGGTASNVYLSDSKTITVGGRLDPYTVDADAGGYIGVTMAVPGTFTDGLSGHGDTTYFVSDDTAYGVRVSGGEAELYQPGVTFFAVNGTDASTAQVLPYNKATALAANAFTRAGWRFVNWNTAEDGSGDAYADGQDVTLKDDLTLFAQWTANQFTVDDIPAQTADGTAKTPAVTVRDAADAAYVLTQDTHYTLSYLLGGSAVGEIKDAGTYTVRVAGAGYYCAADTVDKTFTLSAPEQQPAPAYYDPGPAAKPVVQTFAPAMAFDGGTVAVSPEKAKEGDAVALTATPDEGNRLWSLAATRADGKPLMLTSSALGEASFTMPGCAVTVNAVFAALDAPMPTVVLSPQKITVNGVEATVEAYNIGGTNFFRLRDLAALLRGTPAQFDVDYDAEANAVVVTTGAAYAGEVNASFTDRSATAVMSPQTVYVDGAAVELTACNIGGYNFFGLRELAAIFGYAVGYDAATNTAIIESK